MKRAALPGGIVVSFVLACGPALEPVAPNGGAAPPPPGEVPAVLLPESDLPRASHPLVVAPVAERQPKPWTLHGRTFEDDYAWLRKKDDPKVRAYLDAENAYADEMLAPTAPLQKALFDEIVSRMPEDEASAPVRRGDFFYYERHEKGKEHAIHCRRRGHLDAPEQVMLDLNAVAASHKFASLGPRDVSPKGRWLAYGLDVTGFRQYELHVRDLEKNVDLADRAERVTSVAFANDEKTLFYSVEDPVAKRSYRVYRHALGDAVERDALVYEEKDERFEVDVTRTRSRAFVAIDIASHTTSEVRLVSADKPSEAPRVVLPRKQDQEYDVDAQGDRLLVRINDTGRNFRLVSLSAKNPDPAKMVEIVPHRRDVMLESAMAFREHVVLVERAGGLPRLTVLDEGGGEPRAKTRAKASHTLTMPEVAYDVRPEGNAEFDTRTLRFVYESPITPPTTIDYDVDTRERRVVKRTEIRGGFDRDRYGVERFDVTVRDGTRVPVTLVVPKGAKNDGTHPMVLYGYGAYGHSTDPDFALPVLSLVDRGVVYAIAHVRGGGELGKTWHDAGRMAQKKHSFDDFVDVAEWLQREGWAKNGSLVSWGASAGGLLVTAAANQRPELFRAVVALVPFVDVLNTMLDESLPLTVGEFEEWGNPKNAADLARMAEYSPYDNVAKKRYPAMLVRTSLNDSQVMYWEPAKYVARMRALREGDAPLVFRTLVDPAGHGGRSGRYEKIQDRAADYAFVLWQLGLWQKTPFPDPTIR